MVKEEKLKPIIGETEAIPTATKFSKAKYKSIIQEMIKIVERNEELERRNNLTGNEVVR